MEWLQKSVSYSQSTANNLMRLYEEYGEQSQLGFFEENRLEIFGELTPSQALALIPLPYEQRKRYINEHDMSETSVRDIEAEIKARKQAEERAEDLQGEVCKLKDVIASKEEDESDYASQIMELESEIEKYKEQQAELVPAFDLQAERDKIKAELEKQHKKDIAEAKKAAEEKVKAKYEELENQLSESQSSLQVEIDKAKLEAINEVEQAHKDRIEKLLSDNEALKRKLVSGDNALVQRFSVHFELFQKEFKELLSVLDKLKEEQPEVAGKLSDGLKKVISTMEVR